MNLDDIEKTIANHRAAIEKNNLLNAAVIERVQPLSPLPAEAAKRKGLPLARGLLDYFPAALAAVAEVSRVGNEQHNPGQPLHHNREKSGDHADCIVRHLMERGTKDTDGLRHSAKVAWRALALLQEELEEVGEAPLARGARPVGPAVAVYDPFHLRDER